MKRRWKIIIAVISVGVAGLLIWIGLEVWDATTLSADECFLKAKYMLERAMDDINRERSKIRSRHKLLDELRYSQYKGTSEAIIQGLERTYGKLDVPIADDGFVPVSKIMDRIEEVDRQRLARYDKDLIEAKLMHAGPGDLYENPGERMVYNRTRSGKGV